VTAATLLRSARSTGRTPRSLLDCLIAAVAIRHDLPLLAADRDFEAIAAVSSLRLDRAGA
jgi:predicted nucleic acid-binding protein